MSRTVKSYSYIRLLLHSLKLLHECYGLPFHQEKYLVTRAQLQGLRRVVCNPPLPKLPITPEILVQIHDILDLKCSYTIAWWAAILVGFFGFLRKSNLVPTDRQSLTTGQFLSRNAIKLSNDATVMYIFLNWSKTNQFHERQVILPIAAMSGSILCPVHAVEQVFKSFYISEQLPAFVYSHHGKLHCLTYANLVGTLKASLLRIGIDPRRFAGHSLRRGGCTLAHRAKVSAALLKFHGDWASEAYLKYIVPDVETKLLVTNRMQQLIKSQGIA